MSLIISSINPTDNQRDLAVDAALYVSFNQEVVATSLQDTIFNLVKADTMALVECTVEYYVSDGEYDYQQVVVTPTSPLFKNTQYKLYVNGGTRGVTAEDGSVLAKTFGIDFTTGGAVLPVPEDSNAPEDIYVGNELRIVYSIPAADEMNVTGNSVIITCNQGIPAVTQFILSARNPLGWPLTTPDPWAANAVPTISGKVVTLACDPAVSFDSSLIYSIRMVHPDNTLIPAMEFMTALSPSHTTTEEIRLEYGGAAQDLTDFELALHIYKQSLQGSQAWSGGTGVPTAIPYYLKEWTRYKVVLQLVQDILRNGRSTGAKKISIGDLRMEFHEVENGVIVDLNGRINALFEKVSKGDLGTKPLDGGEPGYALLSRHNYHGSIGNSTNETLNIAGMSRRLPSDLRGL